MSDRKTFEKWAKDKGYSLDFLKHSTGGAYLDHQTQAAWEQWNADPYPDRDPWESYELVCKRISELEATKKMLHQQLRKVELRLRITVSVAVGATAGLATSLLF